MTPCGPFVLRLINQRLMEEQGQVEELQKSLQEQGSKADDVSPERSRPSVALLLLSVGKTCALSLPVIHPEEEV